MSSTIADCARAVAGRTDEDSAGSAASERPDVTRVAQEGGEDERRTLYSSCLFLRPQEPKLR